MTDADTDAPIKRLSTGNRELDEILGGGIPVNSINIIIGEPGSGKTTLAEAFAFANGGDAHRPVLYLTTLSEPLDKVIKYLQQFRFFDLDMMGTSVHYDALGPELAEKGIAALVPRLKAVIKKFSPKIIVIDSFKAIHDITRSTQELRLALHEAGGLLAAYNTTVLLVGEYKHEDIASYPEFAVADGIIELARNAQGSRDERYLRIFKLRGSSYRQGFHAFEITPEGLDVYPRFVSPGTAAAYRRDERRVTSGIPGLDAMLGGGLWTGSATLLAGPTGSGKTTAGIQFVAEGIRRGEHCLFVNFQENPTQLAHQVEELGGKLDKEARGRLDLQYFSAVELSIDRIIVSIHNALRRNPVHRVVIDALGDLAMAAKDPTRMHDYVYALTQNFAARGTTSVLTMETDPPVMASDDTNGRLSHMTDNIVFVDIREKDGVVGRTIRIAKARGMDHDLQPRELRIGDKGLYVVKSKP